MEDWRVLRIVQTGVSGRAHQTVHEGKLTKDSENSVGDEGRRHVTWAWSGWHGESVERVQPGILDIVSVGQDLLR